MSTSPRMSPTYPGLLSSRTLLTTLLRCKLVATPPDGRTYLNNIEQVDHAQWGSKEGEGDGETQRHEEKQKSRYMASRSFVSALIPKEKR